MLRMSCLNTGFRVCSLQICSLQIERLQIPFSTLQLPGLMIVASTPNRLKVGGLEIYLILHTPDCLDLIHRYLFKITRTEHVKGFRLFQVERKKYVKALHDLNDNGAFPAIITFP